MKLLKELLENYRYSDIEIKDIEISLEIGKADRKELLEVKRSIIIDKQIVDAALEELSEIERRIIELRYLIINVMDWEQVSCIMKYSMSQCKRTHTKAMKKLKKITERKEYKLVS